MPPCIFPFFCYNEACAQFCTSTFFYRRMKMHHFNIHICSRAQVQAFVALAMVQPFEVLVGNEKQQINGKSFIGMFSLDYNRPVQVNVKCSAEEFSRFRQEAATFLA